MRSPCEFLDPGRSIEPKTPGRSSTQHAVAREGRPGETEMTDRLLSTLYSADTVERWEREKTMRLSSGIWGREPTLRYLREQVLEAGHMVVDLGTGGGFPAYQMSRVVGPTGRVI